MRAEVLSWDGAHQKWSNLVQPQENSGGGAGNHSGPVHMEIDRTKGKSGKSGKNPLLRDHGTWYVMELCEPLDSLIDFTAPFYGHTDNHNRQRKKPVLMMNNRRCLKKHITMLSLILHLKMQW